MEELQAKNEQLETLVKSLQRENMILQKEVVRLQNELIILQTEYKKVKISPTHIILDTVKYFDTKKPVMSINCFKIQFESPNAKEAQLAKIICQPKNLAKIAKSPVSTETIYAWYKNPEDWFDITTEERSAFEKSLYNSFRRLNDKLASFFRTKKVFVISGKNWGFSEKLEIIPTTPIKP